MLDETAQGYFALIFMPIFVINLLSQLLFRPILSKCDKSLEARDFGAFRKLIVRQALLIVALTLLAILVVQLVGIPALSWMYGIDLSAVKLELIVVTIGGGFVALCNVGYFLLVMLRKQRDIFIAYSLSLVAAVVSCGVLIAVLGLMGACVGFVLSHILLFVIILLSVGRGVRQLAAAPGRQSIPGETHEQ
jgi:O-antigen/teichoic acid export membrane protein